MSLSLNVVKEKEKKGQNEIEGDIEESQVSMVIDDEDVDSVSQYEMENEKDLSNSEIDLEEDIVFGKLFDFSRLSIYCVDSSDHENV